jgi:DNA-binding beta-propeller fold protein YncE
MKKSLSVVFLGLFLLAGFASAQDRPGPSEHALPGAVPPAATTPIATSVEYSPVLLSSAIPSPRGIGVPPAAGRVYVCGYNGTDEIYLYRHGSTQPTGVDAGGGPFAARYLQGFYFGDQSGYIDKLVKGAAKQLVSMPGSLISGLAVDPANGCIYFATIGSSYGIYKLRKGSSTPKLLLSVAFYCYGIAVQGDALYISDYDSGAIYRMPKRGGSLHLFCSGLYGPCDLLFDKGGNLYIAEWLGGRVQAVRAGTSTPVVIAQGFVNVFGIGLDKYGNVYFTEDPSNNGSNGNLWKLERSSK